MHGITVLEKDTSMPPVKMSSAGVQVVFGTAPVNLADDPAGSVNVPILVKDLDEAKAAVGYSKNCDWAEYTLCQSIYSNFEKYGAGPVVLVNVLDPATHKKSVSQKEYAVIKKKVTVPEFGIIKSSLAVKASADGSALTEGTDYITSFTGDGYLTIVLLSASSSASATKLYIAYDVLDPSLVDEDDIIGGVDPDTGTEEGVALVRHIYPKIGVNAGLLLAPEWSHKPIVAAALEAACTKINGCFTADCMVDLDASSSGATKVGSVATAKDALGATDEHVIIEWPLAKDGGKIIRLSALVAARATALDIENDEVPYKSPSNKDLDIDAICTEDGTEIMLDFEQADQVNALGVCTAINRRGFYTWGNGTAAYNESDDPRKRFINIRRFFTWWANDFINRFIDRVDDTASMRLVESVVDEENINCNGFKAKGYCAGASVEYNAKETDVLNGKIVLRQKLTPYPPAETIINEVEYDVTSLIEEMGGEQ